MYLVAIKIDGKAEIFEFEKEEDRLAFLDDALLLNPDLEYAVTQGEGWF